MVKIVINVILSEKRQILQRELLYYLEKFNEFAAKKTFNKFIR